MTTLDVGSGQTYDTDGVDDQIEINNAINAAAVGDTVYLHTGTYNISSSIIFNRSSGIIFKGDGITNTIIQATTYEAFLGASPSHLSMIEYMYANNIEMYGMTIQGVLPQIQPEVYDTDSSNNDSENAVCMYACSDMNIHDVNFTQISMDGIYSDQSAVVTVDNCSFDTCTHDCIQCWGGEDWSVTNCYMHVTSDTGVRYQGTSNSLITGCTFENIIDTFTNGGVYLQNVVSNITISNNTFIDFVGNVYGAIYARPGEATSGTIHLSNNTFTNCTVDVNPENLIVINTSTNNPAVTLKRMGIISKIAFR